MQISLFVRDFVFNYRLSLRFLWYIFLDCLLRFVVLLFVLGYLLVSPFSVDVCQF
jgi:hypothetical protein